MKIALDYDGTYTLDPEGWDRFITLMELRGHRLVCVTARHKPPELDRLQIPIPIVCVPDGYKRRGALAAGHKIDVWIDDEPGMIEESMILRWD